MWATYEDEDDEDYEDERVDLMTGSATTLSGKGRKYKTTLGFKPSKEPNTQCKDHPAYTGVNKLKRSCPACQRLYNAKHSTEITVPARPGWNPNSEDAGVMP